MRAPVTDAVENPPVAPRFREIEIASTRLRIEVRCAAADVGVTAVHP